MSKSEQIGAELATHFASKGLTQEEVASRYGVSQSWIGRIYAGQFSERSIVARRMCKDARVNFDALSHGARTNRANLSVLLDKVWSGTAEDAKLLKQALKVLQKVREAEVRK